MQFRVLGSTITTNYIRCMEIRINGELHTEIVYDLPRAIINRATRPTRLAQEYELGFGPLTKTASARGRPEETEVQLQALSCAVRNRQGSFWNYPFWTQSCFTRTSVRSRLFKSTDNTTRSVTIHQPGSIDKRWLTSIGQRQYVKVLLFDTRMAFDIVKVTLTQ